MKNAHDASKCADNSILQKIEYSMQVKSDAQKP
jgi:hypothetical protein